MFKKCLMVAILVLAVANVNAELVTSNLLVQLESDGSFVLDGTGVATWVDSSGNGNSAYNTTMDLGDDGIYTAMKPTLIQNATPTGEAAIRFTNGSGASSTLMQTTPGAGIINGQAGLAVFVVGKNRLGGSGAGDGAMFVGAARDGGGSSGYGGAGNWFNISTQEYAYASGQGDIHWGDGDWADSATMFYNSGIHTTILNQPPANTTGYSVHTLIWKGGLQNYFDGLTTLSYGVDGAMTTVNAGGLWTIQQMDNLDIGGYDHLGHIYGPSLFDSSDVDIAAILVYSTFDQSGNALSAAQIAEVQDYLTAKYIPEPATMVLLGLGAISMLRRRKA